MKPGQKLIPDLSDAMARCGVFRCREGRVEFVQVSNEPRSISLEEMAAFVSFEGEPRKGVTVVRLLSSLTERSLNMTAKARDAGVSRKPRHSWPMEICKPVVLVHPDARGRERVTMLSALRMDGITGSTGPINPMVVDGGIPMGMRPDTLSGAVVLCAMSETEPVGSGFGAVTAFAMPLPLLTDAWEAMVTSADLKIVAGNDDSILPCASAERQSYEEAINPHGLRADLTDLTGVSVMDARRTQGSIGERTVREIVPVSCGNRPTVFIVGGTGDPAAPDNQRDEPQTSDLPKILGKLDKSAFVPLIPASKPNPSNN